MTVRMVYEHSDYVFTWSGRGRIHVYEGEMTDLVTIAASVPLHVVDLSEEYPHFSLDDFQRECDRWAADMETLECGCPAGIVRDEGHQEGCEAGLTTH